MYVPSIDEIKLQIKTGIISRHPRIRNFSKLSMLDILTEVVAIQAYLQYNRTDAAAASVSVLTATGDDLDKIIMDRLPGGRQDGAQATGFLTYKRGTEAPAGGITIPLGSKALAIGSNRLYFETTEASAIPEGDFSVVVPARAVESGTDGNVSAYTITGMPFAIAGVDRVENASDFIGGTEEETDDELRNRYYYAVLVPGKATTEIIEEHLTDLEDISEAHVYPRAYGDIEIVVDDSNGITTDSSDIAASLLDNVAAGITCSGILCATIDSGVVSPNLAETSGGRLWVRATVNALLGDSMTITYTDSLARTRTGTATIPAGTVRGDAVAATLESSTDRVTSIQNVAYVGTKSYDLLVGMGQYPYLYVLPRPVLVSVAVIIKPTSTPEADLETNIVASITDFLNGYTIGQDLEWSDLFLYMYMDYATSRMFEGIDTVERCQIAGDGYIITIPGTTIDIDEDQRIRAGTITVTPT